MKLKNSNLFKNKKSALDLIFTWVEIVAFILLVIGFIIAFKSTSAVITYIVALLSGFFFGKVWYSVRKKEKFAYFLMIVFFLIGFILGSFYRDKLLIILFYILGIILNYYLFKNKIIK